MHVMSGTLLKTDVEEMIITKWRERNTKHVDRPPFSQCHFDDKTGRAELERKEMVDKNYKMIDKIRGRGER